MTYYDNFWHIDAHENIPSPACLIVLVTSKTENQLMRFCIAYVVADNNVNETVAAKQDPRLHHLLAVLTLILWITEYVEYCMSAFIGNLLKTER